MLNRQFMGDWFPKSNKIKLLIYAMRSVGNEMVSMPRKVFCKFHFWVIYFAEIMILFVLRSLLPEHLSCFQANNYSVFGSHFC